MFIVKKMKNKIYMLIYLCYMKFMVVLNLISSDFKFLCFSSGFKVFRNVWFMLFMIFD